MRLKNILALLALVFLLWLFWPAATRDSAASARGSFIEVEDGSIHYEQSGEHGENVPLVLLHGFGASSFSWRHNLQPLSADRWVLAPDALGFGYSEKRPGGDYSAQAEVDRLRQFLDTLGIEKAILCGSSMGGRNALMFAAAYPERTAGLILINSAGDELGGRGSFIFRIPGVANTFLRVATTRPVIRSLLNYVYYDDSLVTADVVEGYREPLLTRGTPSVLQALSRVDQPPPLEPLLSGISVPVLVIWGTEDPLFPIPEVFLEIPTAELKEIPEAGHLPHEEQPDTVNRVILDFLRQRGY